MNCSRCLAGSASRMRSSTRLASGSADAQHPAPFVGQLDRIGARVFLGAPALQQAFALHAPDDVGERGAVDARAVDETRLAQPLVVGHRDEHRELPRREVAVLHLGVEDISRALTGPVQQVDG